MSKLYLREPLAQSSESLWPRAQSWKLPLGAGAGRPRCETRGAPAAWSAPVAPRPPPVQVAQLHTVRCRQDPALSFIEFVFVLLISLSYHAISLRPSDHPADRTNVTVAVNPPQLHFCTVRCRKDGKTSISQSISRLLCSFTHDRPSSRQALKLVWVICLNCFLFLCVVCKGLLVVGSKMSIVYIFWPRKVK